MTDDLEPESGLVTSPQAVCTHLPFEWYMMFLFKHVSFLASVTKKVLHGSFVGPACLVTSYRSIGMPLNYNTFKYQII